MVYHVYMLKSLGKKSVTYVGYTKNLKKRIIILLIVKPNRYKSIANICIAVFDFARKVTLVFSDWLLREFKSLNAPTQISLEIINEEMNPIKKLFRLILSPIKTNTINNLSAMGSKISPRTETEFVFLAI